MRLIVYVWASPITCVGLLLATLSLRHGRVRVVDGVLEAQGPWLRWLLTRCVPLDGGAAAITFGHVILGQDERALECCRAHEHVHVRQYQRWGPFFPPAYLVASVWAALSGGHYYADNAFEREATASDAGPNRRNVPLMSR